MSCFLNCFTFIILTLVHFNSVQSLSHVWFFVTPWTTAHQASLSITNSPSPPKLMSIDVSAFTIIKLSKDLLIIRKLYVLEWVAYPFSRASSQPRNWTGVSCTEGRFFTIWDIREAHIIKLDLLKSKERLKIRRLGKKLHVLQFIGQEVLIFLDSWAICTDPLIYIFFSKYELSTTGFPGGASGKESPSPPLSKQKS